ncbi:MAG: hypothetical protein JW821_07040 [Deltaproteobacteria bacterium]|nr:hypothetical protein [Deltaproteobacteria bacterium]
MDDVTRLRGDAPIAAPSDRVWAAQKKGKTEDRDRREKRKDRDTGKGRYREAAEEAASSKDRDRDMNPVESGEEASSAYDASGTLKRPASKIDLVI